MKMRIMTANETMRRNSSGPRLRMANRTRRGGSVIAELAVCVPVLLLISISVIEVTSLVFVKQGLAVAAYEGAHRGIQPATTSRDAIAAANEILAQRRIQGASVSISPGEIASVPVGDFYTVTVTAPAGANSISIFRSFNGTTLSASATAMKETEAN